MTKPPFKASDSAINVLRHRGLICALCGLWMSCPLMQYQAYNHLALVIINLI